MEKDKFGCIRCGEFWTGGGQLVEVRCASDETDKVLAALKEIKGFEIKIPTTKRVKEVNGGKYGQYTRYDITQVKREGSWLEVLQINDPPDGRCGNILLAWLPSAPGGGTFFEFDTIENACEAFAELKKVFAQKKEEEVMKMKGCLRFARCGIFKPWFYAVADQALWGDVVFPDEVKEDEVFQFGRKFVVDEYRGIISIKTCVGVKHLVRQSSSGYTRSSSYRLVSWDDGTSTNCWESERKSWPRPLSESEHWIQEAMDSFRELLGGAREKFEILFRDGSKFVGQWKPPKPNDKTCAGHYSVSVVLGNGKKVNDEFDFEPTAETPTAESLLRKVAKERCVTIKEILSLTKERGGFGGKKWAGVF